jgi:hypothetical protein
MSQTYRLQTDPARSYNWYFHVQINTMVRTVSRESNLYIGLTCCDK